MTKNIGIAAFGTAVGVPIWGVALGIASVMGGAAAVGYALGSAGGVCAGAAIAAL